jgi:hypothetical protein
MGGKWPLRTWRPPRIGVNAIAGRFRFCGNGEKSGLHGWFHEGTGIVFAEIAGGTIQIRFATADFR